MAWPCSTYTNPSIPSSRYLQRVQYLSLEAVSKILFASQSIQLTSCFTATLAIPVPLLIPRTRTDDKLIDRREHTSPFGPHFDGTGAWYLTRPSLTPVGPKPCALIIILTYFNSSCCRLELGFCCGRAGLSRWWI